MTFRFWHDLTIEATAMIKLDAGNFISGKNVHESAIQEGGANAVHDHHRSEAATSRIGIHG
jgi:hypothetical protein